MTILLHLFILVKSYKKEYHYDHKGHFMLLANSFIAS